MMSKHKKDETTSKEKIDSLPLTDYMKNRALDWMRGKEKKSDKKKDKKDKKSDDKQSMKDKTKEKKSEEKTKEKKAPKTKGEKSKQVIEEIEDKLPNAMDKQEDKQKNRQNNEQEIDQDDVPDDNDKEKKDQLYKDLQQIRGIGASKAKDLIDKGLKNLNQLHMKKWLTTLPSETQLSLQLKPITEIPHENIILLEPYIKKLDNGNVKVQIVGSYRRQKPISRDIDVMVVSSNENIIDEMIPDIKKLFGQDKVHLYSKGFDKLSFVADVSDVIKKPKTYYKLDFFRVKPEDETPMLLYSTGSKEHNILMRVIAKRKGLLLNQNGLFKKNEKGEPEKIKNLNTEEDYFKYLDMEYKEPKDRI